MNEQANDGMAHTHPYLICDMYPAKEKKQSIIEVYDNLETESVRIFCSNCLTSSFSRVEEDNILNDGKTWAMLCGCFGSCFGIYSILSGENYHGFVIYTHYCTICNTIIGAYQPKTSMAVKYIIILLIFVVISLKIVAFVFIVLPHLWIWMLWKIEIF